MNWSGQFVFATWTQEEIARSDDLVRSGQIVFPPGHRFSSEAVRTKTKFRMKPLCPNENSVEFDCLEEVYLLVEPEE